MAFGISFGSKTQKTDQTKTTDMTEVGTQQGTSQQNQKTNQSSTSNTAGSQAGSTRNDTSQASTSNSTGTQRQFQDLTTTSFSSGTLARMEDTIAGLLGAGVGAVKAHSNFNKDQMVADGMQAATARTQTNLDEALGGIFDAVGGRNNSAAALLAQRVNNDALANLAGIRADLIGKAEGIGTTNLLADNQVTATRNELVTRFLEALRGGTSNTTGYTEGVTTQQQANQATGTDVGQSKQTNQQQTNTQAVEELANTLNQLLNTRTNTTGTENVKGTTKQSGGGFGLSI